MTFAGSGKPISSGDSRSGLGCLLGIGLSANAAEVRSMHVSQTSDGTRITFDLSAPVDYKLFEIANPDRIVLDLHATTFVPDGMTARVDSWLNLILEPV